MADVYKCNYMPSPNRDLLEKNLNLIPIIFKAQLVIYLTVFSGLTVFPTVVSYFTGKTLYILPVQIPGIDETTKNGYTVTAIYHFIMILIAFFGTLISDFAMVGLLINCWSLSKLIEQGFLELSSLAEQEDIELKSVCIVRNLIQRHQEYRTYVQKLKFNFANNILFILRIFITCRYVNCVRRWVYYIVLAEVSSAGLQMILLMFLILIVNFLSTLRLSN